MKLFKIADFLVIALVLCLLGCATTSQAGKPKAEDLLKQGITADNQGDFDQAMDFYRQAIQRKPKLKEAHFRLGQIYVERKMFDEAIVEFKTARDLKYPEAVTELAVTYHKAGKLDEAENLIKELLLKKPNDVDLKYRLGKVYLDKGQLNEAGEIFRQVLQMDPNNASAHNGLANLYFRKRMYNEAMTEFQLAIKLNPDFTDVNLDLGNAYFQSGKYTDASRYFKRYTELSPKDAAGHYMLAKSYQMQKDTALIEPAINEAKKVTKMDSENDGVWYLLGTLYYDIKNYIESAQAFTKSLELSPVDPARWYEAARVYIRAGNEYSSQKDTENSKKMFDAAINAYQKRMELDPSKVEDTYYDMGNAYYYAGYYDEAIQWYQKRIDKNPATAFGAMMNMGYSYSLKGQASKAPKAEVRAIYEKAINTFLQAKSLKMGKNIKPVKEAVPAMEALSQHYLYIFNKFNEKAFKTKASVEAKDILKVDPGNKIAKDVLEALKPKIEVW
jgi:tetratricopeptide (TPR) repeat protein